MDSNERTRRAFLMQFGAGAAALAVANADALALPQNSAAQPAPTVADQKQAATRDDRKTGQKVEFTQDQFTLRLTGLPLVAPDQPATVIEVECDGEPAVDHTALRPLWPRHKVGISV